MSPLLEDADALAADLRTVVALTTGTRISTSSCRLLVDELGRGDRGTPAHEAAVYMLATHFLALGDRPALDALAARWLGPRGYSLRMAGDALRLAVFLIESGWPVHLLRRMMTVIAWSRQGPLWVSLTDVARVGGRYAARLRSVLEHADLLDPLQPAHRAAAVMLALVHDLHRLHAETGPGWVALANTAPDARTVTLFTRSPEVSVPARAAAEHLARRLDLLCTVVSHDHGVYRLDPARRPPNVVPIVPPEPPDVAQGPILVSANCANGFALRAEQVALVLPTGPRLAQEGRWWVAEVLRSPLYAEVGCQSG